MDLQDETRYLFYKNWPDPKTKGLDHWLETLETFISIALNANRIPVIPTGGMTSQNPLNFQLEDYIDISNTKIYKTTADEQIEQQPETLQWISEIDANTKLSNNHSTRYININQLYKNDNSKYKCLFLSNIKKDDPHFNPRYYVKTIPSEKVNKLTDAVLTFFQTTRQSLLNTQDLLYKSSKSDVIHRTRNLVPYACVNLYGVRFKDEFSVSTIRYICNHSTELHETFRNIYLISQDRKSLSPKIHGSKYIIYTYHDFQELQSISQNDYLLYSVEKNIFSHAVVKIYPPGANKLFYSGKSTPPPSRLYDFYAMCRKLFCSLGVFRKIAAGKIRNMISKV